MKAKTFISLILAFILLISLASCKKNDPPASGNDTEKTSTTTPPEESPRNDIADLPENLDFGGTTFTIKSKVQPVAANEFDAALNGSIVEQAVYRRNKNLEDKYHCVILNQEEAGDTNNGKFKEEIEKLNAGGDTEIQIYVTAGYRMTSIAMDGYLTDIYTMDGIDLEKDYYSQGYNRALSIGNHQYLITGKMSLAYYRYMMVMFFNRTLFSNYGVEDPFGLVKNQQWTFEKAAEISRQIHTDTGDIATTVWGYVVGTGTGSSQTDGFMSAANLTLISKDENNYYRMNLDKTAFSDSIDHILELIHNSGSYATGRFTTTTNVNFAVEDYFTGGQAAMISYRLYFAEDSEMVKLGNSGKGYGILPLPKASEQQEDYISYIQDQNFLFGFNRNLNEEQKREVGLFFEAYSSETYATVKPAYYQKALTLRYLNNPDSVSMMEIVDTNVYIDPANVYLSSAFKFTTQSLRSVYGDPTSTGISSLFAQFVDGENSVFQTNINDLNQIFRDMEEKQS